MSEVRLIDANAAADKIMREIETHADEVKIGAVAILIAFARALRDETDFPTIEAEPVRHGRWIETKYNPVGDTMYCDCKCSNCDFEITREKGRYPKFCENCGERMDGGADNG